MGSGNGDPPGRRLFDRDNLSPFVCFVAGTRVVVDIESERDFTSVGTGAKPKFKTVAIEQIAERGGQYVISRDQHDQVVPLIRQKITRTSKRVAHVLQVLTAKDQERAEQTFRVTEEHPFYAVERVWTGIFDWGIIVKQSHALKIQAKDGAAKCPRQKWI